MLLRSQTLPGYGALELGPGFVFAVLETLLGGKNSAHSSVSRELTAIEKKLLANFFLSAQRQLQQAWSVDGPEFLLDTVVASPMSVAGFSANDPIVLAEFGVKVDEALGHMCLAVPASFVRQRRQNVDPAVQGLSNFRQPWERGPLLKQLRKGTVRAETVLTKATIRVGDLAALEPGDILDLGYSISSPLSLCVNGTEVCSGYIVPTADKRAFSIQSMIAEGVRS